MKYHILLNEEKRLAAVGTAKKGSNLTFMEDKGLFKDRLSARERLQWLEEQGYELLCKIDAPDRPTQQELSSLLDWSGTFFRTATQGNLDPEGIVDPVQRAAVTTMLKAAATPVVLPKVTLLTVRRPPSKYEFWEAA